MARPTLIGRGTWAMDRAQARRSLRQQGGRRSASTAMALQTNKPTAQDVTDQMLGVDTSQLDATALNRQIATQLARSISKVENAAATFFDGRFLEEKRDGNGTSGMAFLKGPATSVSLVKVELPVLALTRTYTDQEVKLYTRQRRFEIFTFKLGAEQASLHLDQQIYGNILPTLPQCVSLQYCAGFPLVDDQDAPTVTSFDGETTDYVTFPKLAAAGDARDPKLLNDLAELQEAVACDAAAAIMGRILANPVGFVTSVSFDGFSKSFNPQAYAQAIQACKDRYAEVMGVQKRGFFMATT